MGISMAVKPEEVETMTLLMDIKTLFIGMAFLGYIFMAIGFLLSVIIKSSKQGTSIALGVFFTTYIFGIIGKMKDELEGFLYLSPFDYVVPAKLLKNGFEVKYVLLGLGIIAISIVTTYAIYNKKDLA